MEPPHQQLSPRAQRQLSRFSRQYLQLQLTLDYPDGEYLRDGAFQCSLYQRLFAARAVEHPPPPRYQLHILKQLTRRIEASIQDWDEQGISDEIMTYLASLLSSSLPSEVTSAQRKSYVTYSLSSLHHGAAEKTPIITLLEARSLVAASGTTGLRTWEAALHLGNYLCANASNLIHGKSILELGAGTGYLSILCAKHLGAFHVLATDGSDEVVAGLSTNFYLNGLQDTSFIEGKELTWGHALVAGEHPEWHAGRKVDLVLGTDLTYDETGIPALVSTFEDLFELYPDVNVLIGATIRNLKTFDIFLAACRSQAFIVEDLKYPMITSDAQGGPFYSDLTPIQFCHIMKRQSKGSSLRMQFEYTNEKA